MQRKSLETTSALQFELSHLQEEVLAHKASEVALREQLSQYEMSARKLKVTEAELLSLQRYALFYFLLGIHSCHFSAGKVAAFLLVWKRTTSTLYFPPRL